jgi:hypothetical protein
VANLGVLFNNFTNVVADVVAVKLAQRDCEKELYKAGYQPPYETKPQAQFNLIDFQKFNPKASRPTTFDPNKSRDNPFNIQ